MNEKDQPIPLNKETMRQHLIAVAEAAFTDMQLAWETKQVYETLIDHIITMQTTTHQPEFRSAVHGIAIEAAHLDFKFPTRTRVNNRLTQLIAKAESLGISTSILRAGVRAYFTDMQSQDPDNPMFDFYPWQEYPLGVPNDSHLDQPEQN